MGTLNGKTVIAMQGRFHYYEGYTMEQVTFPVLVMEQLGIETVIVTSAAGGINKDFSPGQLMIVTDHINNMGTNPLLGANNEDIGVRFPGMSQACDRELLENEEECAVAIGRD